MAGNASLATEGDSPQAEFDRIDGELDAALVFAAAAEQAWQNGSPEFAATCMSDAKDSYVAALAAILKANLAGAQLHELKGKLLRLRRQLDAPKKGNRPAHEAA